MLHPNDSLLNSEFYQALLDNLFEALYVVDHNKTIVYWNKGCERLTGYAAEEMMGRSYDQTAVGFEKLLNPSQVKSRLGIQRVLQTLIPGKWKGAIQRKDGQAVYIKSHITPIILGNGQIAGAAEVLRNMTSQLALEETHLKILEISRRDQLTGLYNRCAITEFFKAELERSVRYQQPFSIIIADIDHFKRFNDQYGHDTGDRILSRVGRLFDESIRQPDVAGRCGGEEFLILTPNSDREAARQLAQRLCDNIRQMSLDGLSETITASFGISQLNQSQTTDQLLYQADQALYRAKNHGRDQVALG